MFRLCGSLFKNSMRVVGACEWFARNNPHDRHRSLRRCRWGSLCRYLHWTREEADEWAALSQRVSSDPVSDIPCPPCRGIGVTTIHITGFSATADGDASIPCLKCKGSGKIRSSPARQRQLTLVAKAVGRDWCTCGHPDALRTARYHPDNSHPRESKHCYTCRSCRGLIQVG